MTPRSRDHPGVEPTHPARRCGRPLGYSVRYATPTAGPGEEVLMLSPEKKERFRAALLKIKTPEKRRQAIRLALKLVQTARIEAERAIRKASGK